MSPTDEVGAAGIAEFASRLRAARVEQNLHSSPPLLDGLAAATLREVVPLPVRRHLGAFFTPQPLADALAEPLGSAKGSVVVVDPHCGAGDLLLAAARSLGSTAPGNLTSISIRGTDIVAEFASIASMRLRFQCEASQVTPTIDVRHGNGLESPDLAVASHLLLNPPFTTTSVPNACSWASGTVNCAAVLLADAVTQSAPGTLIRAILPDVLRSGTRYRRWRKFISTRLDIDALETWGRFDRWTDVDVFLLGGLVRSPSDEPDCGTWVQPPDTHTVSTRFVLSVGSVVNYRDPHRGSSVPYLTSKQFPTWQTIPYVKHDRLYVGRLLSGPFVVIPRTSRPDEKIRARGAVVTDKRPIAVDNHLIVATPRDCRLASCLRLLDVLKDQQATDWLNRAIRCRHLTLDAVGSIPWMSSDD